ncbi:MAG: hypothetical protein ABSG89_08455 [Bacteroidales bacterium]|jgi:hypothetical protein
MKKTLTLIFIFCSAVGAFGQQFEESVPEVKDLKKPIVQVGADFAMQLQSLSHHADSTLIPLGKGINLPTANLNLSAILVDGIQVNLTVYLSSRHHLDTWVKGGYLLIDKLPFLRSRLIDTVMNYMTFKVGVMELDYGDAHFRRSDNGHVIDNMFVGNYIMDAFTTAPAFEALYRNKGILLLGGVTSGTLDPTLVGYNATTQVYTPYYMGKELAFYWKAGYDKKFNDDFRLRATLSGYHDSQNHFGSLYGGDRTGSRYYLVMNLKTNNPNDVDPSVNHLSGDWGPGFTNRDNSLMFNLLAKYKGIELFGTIENVNGTPAFGGPSFNYYQYVIDGLYHFGKEKQFFGGARYDYVNNNTGESVDRMQISCGWFLTPKILIKAEYVDQNYNNFSIYGADAGFKGTMIESTVSF